MLLMLQGGNIPVAEQQSSRGSQAPGTASQASPSGSGPSQQSSTDRAADWPQQNGR